MALVHLFRFPRITINHGIVLFGFAESESQIEFEAYDPNIPAHPVKLVYEKKRRVFTFAPNIYWGGGVLSVMEIFCDWPLLICDLRMFDYDESRTRFKPLVNRKL